MLKDQCPWLGLPAVCQPESSAQWNDWRWQLAHAVRDPHCIPWMPDTPGDGLRKAIGEVSRIYRMQATPYYLSLAETWMPDDPILRQIIPGPEEMQDDLLPADGLAEQRDSPAPGLVHRYPDRLLVLLTGACAVLCRHCFRKRFWRDGESYPEPDLEQAMRYIRDHSGITEVILSGGDALLFPEAALLAWLEALAAIPHVSAVRIASRLPVVLPQRVDKALCRAIADRAPVWMMTQFNHPLELTPAAALACHNLVSSGIPVMNQTVLLKGVNDRPEILAELFRGLVGLRVKPHYLFHGDPVAGTGHFRTGIACGLRIMKELRGKISGLAMPRFAIDLPDGGGKVALEPDFSCGEGFEAIDGRMISYF